MIDELNRVVNSEMKFFVLFFEEAIMDIVDRIDTLCRLNGTTIKALERDIGLSHSSIMKWRKSSAGIDNVYKVATVFGVSLDYLYTGENIRPVGGISVTNDEARLLATLRTLNDEGLEQVRSFIDERVRLGYIKSDAAPMVQGA